MTLLETEHQDVIHDAQLDYYGKKLATCSSDKSIKIFAVGSTQSEPNRLLETLVGHDGPVWQVSWAHPKFGTLLASCSYDAKVCIWRDGGNGATGAKQWVKMKEYAGHSASVNSVAWAPHEYGLVLAAGSSDGKVSILTWKNEGTWDIDIFPAHSMGVNAVSWAPSVVPGSLIQLPSHGGAANGTANGASSAVKRLVTAGCDNVAKIWVQGESGNWTEESVLQGHSDWVRDVAWAPSVGLETSYIASCSQDKTVLIWTQLTPGSQWLKNPLGSGETGHVFPDCVWRVSWSTSGSVLAVSCGDNKVSLWKENLEGVFEQIGDVAQ